MYNAVVRKASPLVNRIQHRALTKEVLTLSSASIEEDDKVIAEHKEFIENILQIIQTSFSKEFDAKNPTIASPIFYHLR